MRQFVWKEILYASRFGLVGIMATLIHMTVVWFLVSFYPLPVLASNLIAFLVAFSVSFSGNYYWTFRANCSLKKALTRLFLISGSAFLVNSFLLSWLLDRGFFSPTVSAITAVGIIPVITFVSSRLWVFRND